MAQLSADAKRAEWADRLRRQAESGLSIAAFCRRDSISEAGFYYWKKQLKASGESVQGSRKPLRPPPSDSHPRFVELQNASTSLVPCVEISVASGALIRVPADNVAAIEAAVTVVAASAARSPEGTADA